MRWNLVYKRIVTNTYIPYQHIVLICIGCKIRKLKNFNNLSYLIIVNTGAFILSEFRSPI